METVVHEGADIIQVQGLHVLDSLGGLLESSQAHVEVDLIQVSAVERVQLEGSSAESYPPCDSLP